MMTRRERLTRTLHGLPVDRPAVCFYELNGLDENPADGDPFNIYSDPSWKPLLDLTREKTDRIVIRYVPFPDAPPDPAADLTTEERWTDSHGSRFTRTLIRAGGRTLTRLNRRDPDVRTIWTVEHLLKDEDDLQAWLDLPRAPFGGSPDIRRVLETERQLGDTGIVMLDTADPIGIVAGLFDMAEYTILAMTQEKLMHRALEKAAEFLLPKVEAIAQALPGRMWRICGPEYASPPYLPPRLFAEYVTRYVTPMVQAIQKHGGFARVHSHGRLKDILDEIASTGCDALDPIEPPPQGDVELSYVRERYGKQLVLFGNLEVADIENLPADAFEEKVRQALREGTAGTGRGFVLLPSACPYGRTITDRTLRNYETMVRLTEQWGGN
ncbi:MAG TPA: uroporphyrinogen decarboxylase family protein [Phycisphaerae bacterium]|nr:uroporphyrinogen decarboxylase family protein [Phycisphaerae bacterium]